MAEFPTVNFQTGGEGLFTADEIQRLMRAECDRASRYRYPVSCMLIGVDRLEQLGDLYGAESRAAILKEVERLLRGVTRESDFLGCLFDHRFLAMFPHTPRQAGPAMARRILAGARKLVFDEGHSSVQVTLSVGLTHRAPFPIVPGSLDIVPRWRNW